MKNYKHHTWIKLSKSQEHLQKVRSDVIHELMEKFHIQRLDKNVMDELLEKTSRIKKEKQLKEELIKELFKRFNEIKARDDKIASEHSNVTSLSSASTSIFTPISSLRSTPSLKTATPLVNPFELFIENIKNIYANNDIKIEYLIRLHDEEKQKNPHGVVAQNNLKLLTIIQLDKALDFIIQNQKDIEADLNKVDSIIIARKNFNRISYDRHYKDKGEIPFTLQIEKNDDQTISVYLLPMSKIANHTKVPTHKKSGASTSVTPRILINPQYQTTKLLDSVSKKTNDIYETKRLANELKGFGNNHKIGPIYISSKNGQHAIRSSTKTAIGDLTTFINPKTQNSMLMHDKFYAANPNSENKDIVLTRLVGSLLQSMKKFHSLGMIHNDVKDLNVLVFIDNNGHVQAEIADFDFSISSARQISGSERDAKLTTLKKALDQGKISLQEYERHAYNIARDYGCSRPVATSCYASPEVVAFHVQCKIANIPTAFNLYDGLVAQNSVGQTVLRDYYGATIYGHSKRFINKNCTQLFSDQKDDMFSLGIVIYMLLTQGHYPTGTRKLNEQDIFTNGTNGYYFDVKGLETKTAFIQYPLLAKFKPLVVGLLRSVREKRLDSTAAENLFKTLIDDKPELKSNTRAPSH